MMTNEEVLSFLQGEIEKSKSNGVRDCFIISVTGERIERVRRYLSGGNPRGDDIDHVTQCVEDLDGQRWEVSVLIEDHIPPAFGSIIFDSGEFYNIDCGMWERGD